MAQGIVAKTAHQVMQADAEASADPHAGGEAADAGGMQRDDPAQVHGTERAGGAAAAEPEHVARGVPPAVVREVHGLAQDLSALTDGGGIAGGKDAGIAGEGEIRRDNQAAVAQALHMTADFRHGERRAAGPADKGRFQFPAADDGAPAVEGIQRGAQPDVGALRGQALLRLHLDGDKIVSAERLLTDLGERIRTVKEGPDGALYLLTDSGQGRLLKLTP